MLAVLPLSCISYFSFLHVGRPPPLPVSPTPSSGDVDMYRTYLTPSVRTPVLQSSDRCEVRVPKLYITKFSLILGALIQRANRSFVPHNAKAMLPVVQLPESGTTLISLLSFVFPLSPTLPSTPAIEATMELLSAAQKYEMISVLAHIRLILAQQDPPFIREDNAFRAYSLAHTYGLRQEAVNAAQLTLKKGDLILENLEGELDILPGVYLHELWEFHKRFRTCLMSDITCFRKNSSLISTLEGVKCISRAPSGIPTGLITIL
ncbi:hypothetical protein EI94DRAFT_1808443 [Lactarius quietus]|nr:hypothetical protein EI94DRAFT_1808443 [Lactarius quietus]